MRSVLDAADHLAMDLEAEPQAGPLRRRRIIVEHMEQLLSDAQEEFAAIVIGAVE